MAAWRTRRGRWRRSNSTAVEAEEARADGGGERVQAVRTRSGDMCPSAGWSLEIELVRSAQRGQLRLRNLAGAVEMAIESRKKAGDQRLSLKPRVEGKRLRKLLR